MAKTLIRSGNSLALVIDKPLLQLANIDENTPVQIGFDGKNLTISAVPSDDQKLFEKAKSLSIKRYAKAYKRLAE